MAEPHMIELTALPPRLERAFDFATRQVRATIERSPDFFPIYTVGGKFGVDESVKWGEFSCLEAVAKALGIRVRAQG